MRLLWLSIYLGRNNYPTIMNLYIIVTQYSSLGGKVNAKVLPYLSQPITNLIKLHGHKNKKLWKQIDFTLWEVWLTITNFDKFYECLILHFHYVLGKNFSPFHKALLVKIPRKCTNMFLYPSKKKVGIVYNEKRESATTSGSGSIIGQWPPINAATSCKGISGWPCQFL